MSIPDVHVNSNMPLIPLDLEAYYALIMKNCLVSLFPGIGCYSNFSKEDRSPTNHTMSPC